MQTTIAKISGTHLGFEDHGIFSVTIMFNFGHSGQSFGPYATTDTNIIVAILNACGVRSWEQLKGRTVYAVHDDGYNGLIRGIAPLPTESGKGFVVTTEGVESYMT
jgi:hypothetical protein